MSSDEPSRGWRELRFAALDTDARRVAEDLVSALSRRVALPCRLVSADAGEAAWVEGREQLDADALLARLERQAGAGDGVLVGVTAHDIGNPIFTFFFGRARLGGRAALISLARLR